MAGVGTSDRLVPAPALPFVPVTLTVRHVRLVPLSTSHVDALAAAVQDGRVWEL